jgi:hypothetical protein
VKSGNRLTLLRDANGDGVYEGRTVFADKLNAPYGLALVGNYLYVANQDALVRFDYRPRQTKSSGPPTKVADLPSAINHHWTKSLAASPDGRFLYVGIGSNSNITERGMLAEVDRAMVWEVDAATGAHRPYATGLRNPTALAIQPGSGQLWAAVNERDEMGPNLAPDYLTVVRGGGFGQEVEVVEAARRGNRIGTQAASGVAAKRRGQAMAATRDAKKLRRKRETFRRIRGHPFSHGRVVGHDGDDLREFPVLCGRAGKLPERQQKIPRDHLPLAVNFDGKAVERHDGEHQCERLRLTLRVAEIPGVCFYQFVDGSVEEVGAFQRAERGFHHASLKFTKIIAADEAV